MRLCVETYLVRLKLAIPIAAAFVRLCVETAHLIAFYHWFGAAAFVRLCVETVTVNSWWQYSPCSRLRAAVC